MRWTLGFTLLAALAAPVPASAAAARGATHALSPLPWIADDYPRAVALAKARKVPIFVEAWAPW